MNRLRICFVAILLLICGVGLSAQEPAKPDLIYEFGKFPCDGFRGNIDILIAELRENPESDAIVVNIGRGKYEVWTTLRGEMIRNHIAYRGFDASRIGYSREVGDEFKTQFFRIPAGKMKTAPASRNYVLTSLSEPYVIEDYDFDDLCPPLLYKDLFATIIEQNPNITATILFRDKTLRAAEKRKKEIASYLTKERKIDPSRRKMFLTVKPDFEYGKEPYVEYRLIP